MVGKSTQAKSYRTRTCLPENMPPSTHLSDNKRLVTTQIQTKHSKVESSVIRSKHRRGAPSLSPENSEEEGHDENSARAMKALRIGAESAQNLQGYRPGSITRIQLHNFVTYDHMEVQPGPHMNMIIGPNGTGKSTIVCAIALGLGERPSVLGRAKDISEFVKHGHERGSIEITLAARQPDEGELTIQREIIREGNKSTWRINGRSTSLSDVQKAIRELDIQVGNLCQFLPQDRVVEFSKMSPQDLLKETQRAVGRGDLLEQQQQLTALRSKETQTMSEMRRVTQDTETLRKQNDVLERDVQRWQERQAAESQLRVLTALLPVIRYIEAKNEHDRTKDARRQAHAHYLEMKNASGPAEEEIEELETRIAQSDGNRRQIQDELTTSDREARQQTARFERFETTQRDLTAELDDIKKRAQRRRENIARLRTEITELEAAHDSEPPDDGSRELAQVGAELNQEKLNMTNQIIQLQDEQKALTRTGQQLSREMTRSDSQLRDLDNVELQRRETLRRFNEDTFRALEWLEQNRGMFKQHVFSPVCLEASVRDARYANLIETVVGVSTLRTFVAQSEEDYHTFTREVNDRQRLRVDVVCFRRALDSFQAPQPRDKLQQLGFDGYVLDFIEAPQAVLAALCGRDKIHEVPLALGRVDSDRIEQQQLFREYIADGTRFTISRGRYGSRAATVVTSRVRPNARLLSAGESDEVRATRNRLHTELDKLRDQLAASEEKMKKLSVREQKVRNGHRAIEAREEELRLERQRVSKLTAAWEREKVHLDTRRAQLTSMVAEDRRDARGGQSVERQRIEKSLSDNARSRADAIVTVARQVQSMADAAHRLAVALAGAGGQRDLRRLNELRAEAERHREGIITAQQAFDQATEAYNDAKIAARSCLDETRRVTEDMSDAERQAVREAQDQRRDISLDELEIELATCRQRLSLAANSGLSARVLEQYEERKLQLTNMTKDLLEMEKSLRRVRKSKLSLRRRWEQPLADIVRQIGDAFTLMFDQIGCMGEVTLLRAGDGIVSHVSNSVDDPGSPAEPCDSQQQSRRNHRQTGGDVVAEDDEDYGRWGVEIRVAFRKDEAMQVLDNHRQSGGERAVSTILYLQAMQSLVAAPFRVVDEINQGMDARNERLIHEIVVDTACRQDSAQYFLITPKLLPDLNYHPMMKVLCIFNGEWQPESFDFSKYITHATRRPAVAAASMVARA